MQLFRIAMAEFFIAMVEQKTELCVIGIEVKLYNDV